MKCDFPSFARRVSFFLETTNLSTMCGLRFVRFYVAPKRRAEALLREIADVNHDYMDVFQLYRADNLSFDRTNDAIVVRNAELRTFLTGAVKFGSKLQFYRIGFCRDMGFFATYASPKIDDTHLVTHMQVYNAAAKMARITDSGFLPSFLICRGFDNKTNKRLKNTGYEAMQYVRDILEHCKNYVAKDETTRIEEVLTFDRLTVEESIPHALNRYKVFDKTALSLTTSTFLNQGVLYRLSNWRHHLQTSIGNDLQILRKLITDRDFMDTMSWVAPPLTAQIIRAEFRVTYFLHGNSTRYNYDILRHMFTNGSELRAIHEEFVRLRVIDLDNNFRFPIFTTKLPSNELNIIKHVWSVMCDIWWGYRYHGREEEEDLVEPTRFLITVYATWAYRQIRKQSFTTQDQSIAIYRCYENAFRVQNVLRECEAARGTFTMRIANKRVSADRLFNAIVKDATTPFASIVRMCVRITSFIDSVLQPHWKQF